MAAKNQPQPGGWKKLTLEDLRVVLQELLPFCSKWYNIGLQLHVPVTELQKIESEYKNDHSTCLRQMLIKWLESGKGSWESLCKALESPMVKGEDNRLVTKLREKYCKPDKKAKKRLGCAMEPTAEATTAKKAKMALPDTIDPSDFINMPSSDRCCAKCGAVPTNPQRSACCNSIYCEPCSKRERFCLIHRTPVSFEYDKHLRAKILDLRSNCPNWKNGCQFKDDVSKVYRHHLLECQYQGRGTILSDTPTLAAHEGATQRASTHAEPRAFFSAEPKPALPTLAQVARDLTKKLSTGAGPSKAAFTPEAFHDVKPKPKASQVRCKYHRIGCSHMFPTYKKMEQHLLEHIQQHLDLAIVKIEEILTNRQI